MSPLQLVTVLIVAAAVAAPVSANTSPSGLCGFTFGRIQRPFDRYGPTGNATCHCVTTETASCSPLQPYPTVSPLSPAALLNLYHRPSTTRFAAAAADPLLTTRLECTARQRNRLCSLTQTSHSRSSYVCDCARN